MINGFNIAIQKYPRAKTQLVCMLVMCLIVYFQKSTS